MTDTTTLWAVVVAAGIGTFALRLSFIQLFGRFDEIPGRLALFLRFVPAAVLAALVAPAVLAPAGDPLAAPPPRLIAAGVAVVIAWRTGNLFATIGLGMVTLWVVNALL